MIFYLGTFNSHDTHHWIRLALKIILLSFKTWFVFSNKVKKIISDYPFHSRNQKTRKKNLTLLTKTPQYWSVFWSASRLIFKDVEEVPWP